MATAPNNPTQPTQPTQTTDKVEDKVEAVEKPKVLTAEQQVELLKKGGDVTIDVKMIEFHDFDSGILYPSGTQVVKGDNVTKYMEGQVKSGKIHVLPK